MRFLLPALMLFAAPAAAAPPAPAPDRVAEAMKNADPTVRAGREAGMTIVSAKPDFNPADKANLWFLDLSTGGRVTVLLRPDFAPAHVKRIRELTARGFYDGLVFHRVIEGFMAQGGDPKGTGQGGSELPNLKSEFNELPHVRGAVSMARADQPDTANSQFFIMFSPNLKLDRNYTVFGRVIDGMQYVDAIERGEPPASPSRVVQASLGDAPKPLPNFAELKPPAAPDLAAAAAALTPKP